MHTFTDTQARAWTIAINVRQLKHVRELTGVDLSKLTADGFSGLQELLSDPCLFVDVVFALVTDQAAAASVTDEDFGRGMAGDCLWQARQRFLGALGDFLPTQAARDMLRKTVSAADRMMELVAEEAEKRLADFDVEAAARQLMEPAVNGTA